MFETVTLTTCDLDKIVDALAYYRQVRLVTNAGALSTLINKVGFDNYVRCVEHGALRVLLETHQYAVHTETLGLPIYTPITFSFAAEADGTKVRSPAHAVELMLARAFKGDFRARKIIKFVLENSIIRPELMSVVGAARSSFRDASYVQAAVKSTIRELVPEYDLPDSINLTVVELGGGFVITLGLDFKELNRFYHRRVPEAHSTLSPAFLLAHLVTAQRDIICATEGDTDFWGESAVCACIQARVEKAIAIRRPASANITAFHSNIVKRPSFGSLVDSGRATFAQFLDLMEAEETSRFKSWLVSQKPTSDIVQEYYRSAFSSSSPVQFRLGKVVTFTGLGALIDAGVGTLPLGTVSGAVAGAAVEAGLNFGDEFVFSRLLGGWRPDQWVEGPVRGFYGAE